MVGRKTRRAKDVTNHLNGPAPVLSHAVDVALPNDILNPRVAPTVPVMFNSTQRRHAQGAAQNRRGRPIERFSSWARRVFRPTDQGVHLSAKNHLRANLSFPRKT